MRMDYSQWLEVDRAEAARTYAVADSSTLAALYPVLQSLQARAREELRILNSGPDEAEFSAALDEMRSETLAMLANRDDVSEGAREEIRSMFDEILRMDDKARNLSQSRMLEATTVIMSEAVAARTRMDLVEAELARRGLVPIQLER